MAETKFDIESPVQAEQEYPYVIMVNPGGSIDSVTIEMWEGETDQEGEKKGGLMHREGYRRATAAESRQYHEYINKTRHEALAKLHGVETPNATDTSVLPKLESADKNIPAGVPAWVGKPGVDPAITPEVRLGDQEDDPGEDEGEDGKESAPPPTNEYRTKNNKPGPGK